MVKPGGTGRGERERKGEGERTQGEIRSLWKRDEKKMRDGGEREREREREQAGQRGTRGIIFMEKGDEIK